MNQLEVLILLSALIVSLGHIILITLLNTKNFHNLPIPSLKTINILFSILVLIILIAFFQYQFLKAEKTRIEFFIFLTVLISGLSVILVDILEESILGPPILIIAFLLQIFLLFYLGKLLVNDAQDFFANGKIIILLIGLGMSTIFISDLVVNFRLGYLPIYFVLIGNFMILCSLLIFSTTILLLFYLNNKKSMIKLLSSFLIPLISAFIFVMVILNQDVMIQIVTTTLSQTLNITIIREIPEISFPLQSFSLMLSIGVIFLTIVGIFSLFSNSKDKYAVIWILVMTFLGIEILTQFRNVIRIIALFYIYQHVGLMERRSEFS
ncbi:MAG: hypothetical protein ACXAC2_06940 [Candidatus Kariarchaeaceae archaeon]|jgi:hypothetical protein